MKAVGDDDVDDAAAALVDRVVIAVGTDPDLASGLDVIIRLLACPAVEESPLRSAVTVLLIIWPLMILGPDVTR